MASKPASRGTTSDFPQPEQDLIEEPAPPAQVLSAPVPPGGPPDLPLGLRQRAEAWAATKVSLVSQLVEGDRSDDFKARWARWAEEVAAERQDLQFVGLWDDAATVVFGRRPQMRVLRLADLRFPGDVAFTLSRFAGGIDCRNARFEGAVFIGRYGTEIADGGNEDQWPTRLLRKVDFEGATFAKGLRIEDCEITVQPRFERAEFQGAVEVRSCRLGRGLGFAHASLEQGALFEDGECRGDIDFVEATVSGDVIAYGIQIDGKLDLTGATLRGDTQGTFDASNCQIRGDLLLDRAKVQMALSFDDARLEGAVSLVDSTVVPSVHDPHRACVSFRNATFAGNVDFRGAHISSGEGGPRVKSICFEMADFDKSSSISFGRSATRCTRLKGTISFENASLPGSLSFSDAEIEGGLMLNRAMVGGPVDCAGVKFRRSTGSLAEPVDFSDARFESAVNFGGAIVGQPFTVRRAYFKAALDIDGVNFSVLPDVRLARFEVWPSISSAHFDPSLEVLTREASKSEDSRSLVDQLRALRFIATKSHDIDNRNLLSRLEMRAAKDRSPLDGFVEGLYQLVARCGDSFLRPAAMLFLFGLVVFPTLYLTASNVEPARLVRAGIIPPIAAPVCAQDATATFDPTVSAFYLSLRSTVPIGAGDDDTQRVALDCLFGKAPSAWQLAVARLVPYLQLALSIILLGLVAIGIQQRLRIRA